MTINTHTPLLFLCSLPLSQVQLCHWRGTAGPEPLYLRPRRPDWIKAGLIPVEFVSFFQVTLNPNQIMPSPNPADHKRSATSVQLHRTHVACDTSFPTLTVFFCIFGSCDCLTPPPSTRSKAFLPLQLWLTWEELIDRDRPCIQSRIVKGGEREKERDEEWEREREAEGRLWHGHQVQSNSAASYLTLAKTHI